MPDQAIRKIMAATEPADVAQMAMIECVRQMADNGKQTNKLLEAMQAELRDVRERVIRIEATEFKTELRAAKSEIERLRKEAKGEMEALDARVDALEMEKDKREGVKSAADWFFRNWPGLLALFAMVAAVLVTTGRVRL